MIGRCVPVLALVLVALAFPVSAAAQSPGDQQYNDPFAGESPKKERSAEPQSSAPAQSQGTGEAAPAQSGTQSRPGSQAESGQSDAPARRTLPATGAPAGLLAAIGVPLLLAGVALRRRL